MKFDEFEKYYSCIAATAFKINNYFHLPKSFYYAFSQSIFCLHSQALKTMDSLFVPF